MRTVTRGIGVLALIVLVAEPAFAQGSGEFIGAEGMKYLSLALAVIGAAMGQGKVLSSALDSMGRNPGASGQMFLPWLLGIVFIEALFVLTWLVLGGIL